MLGISYVGAIFEMLIINIDCTDLAVFCYLDVGDECWKRNVLMTSLRCR